MAIKDKIRSLITRANSTTGRYDADLTTAVLALCAGYGEGGGEIPVTPPSGGGGTGAMKLLGEYTWTSPGGSSIGAISKSTGNEATTFNIKASYDCGIFYVLNLSNYFGNSVNAMCKGAIVYTQDRAMIATFGNRSGNTSAQTGSCLYTRGQTGKGNYLDLTAVYGSLNSYQGNISNGHTIRVWECEMNSDIADLICSDIAREAINV